MALINPHINFNGNAQEAFRFYQSVFGGTITNIVRFKDIASEEMPIGAEDADKLMNIALPIGPNFLIGNDVPSFMGKVSEEENRSKISVNAENREEALRLFRGLSVSGTVEVPIQEDDENSNFGMFRDQFWIEWIIKFNSK